MILFRDNWRTEVENGPVNLGAWVFHERVLATRVLHFTLTQIHWECNSCTASEMHPQHDPESLATAEAEKAQLADVHTFTSRLPRAVGRASPKVYQYGYILLYGQAGRILSDRAGDM